MSESDHAGRAVSARRDGCFAPGAAASPARREVVRVLCLRDSGSLRLVGAVLTWPSRTPPATRPLGRIRSRSLRRSSRSNALARAGHAWQTTRRRGHRPTCVPWRRRSRRHARVSCKRPRGALAATERDDYIAFPLESHPLTALFAPIPVLLDQGECQVCGSRSILIRSSGSAQTPAGVEPRISA